MFSCDTMCGLPARTVGWRDPGFIHTSFLKDLWPNLKYMYRVGHRLFNGQIVWGRQYSFKAAPYPGEDSLQRVIFGDLSKLLSGPLMSPVLERKLSIQPGRRASGDAEHPLKPIASPSLSLCASEKSRRLKPQSSVRSRDARRVYEYDDHRRRERDDRLLARVDSIRSSRTAMPRLHQGTPEQRLSRLASNRSSRVAEPRRGVASGSAPRADRSDRHSRLRGSSGRGDRSSSSSSPEPERSSRRRSVSRAPSSRGRATVRGVGAYGSSTRRYSGRLDSGLSMGVRSRRGSERAGRGAATPRRSSSSDSEAVTIRSRIRPNRELTERCVRGSEETGERSLRRRQRKEGAVGGSTSMGWSSRRPRRALDRIDSGSTYSSSSSAAASPSPSTSPTAPPSTLGASASSCSSSVSVSRRGSALPEYEFKEASSASRSRRRRERQERREGRLRRFKDKLALVFHHRHDHHHHHHIGRGRSGSPVPRRGRRSKNSKSPWSYLGGIFHRSTGNDAKKKTTSRTVVPVPAKRRGGGHAHSLFGALVKHKLGARKAPTRAPMVRAGSLSRMQVNKMHWWQRLRQRRGRAEGSGRPRRRLGQGKAL